MHKIDPLILTILGKGVSVSADCDVTDETCTVAAWYKNRTEFVCKLAQCNQVKTKGQADWQCSKARCDCGPLGELCLGPFAAIQGVLHNISGPTNLKCNADLQCSLSDPVLTSIFPQGIQANQCVYGECGLPDTTGDHTLDSVQVSMLVIGMFVGGALLFVILASVWQHHVMKRMPMADPMILSSFSFNNISYTLRGKRGAKSRVLLDNVNGHVMKGQMLAVIGFSGAGKSTLMDILAGNKKAGVVTGDIQLNSHTISSR